MNNLIEIDMYNFNKNFYYCTICDKYINIEGISEEFHEMFNYSHQKKLLQMRMNKLYNSFNTQLTHARHQRRQATPIPPLQHPYYPAND